MPGSLALTDIGFADIQFSSHSQYCSQNQCNCEFGHISTSQYFGDYSLQQICTYLYFCRISMEWACTILHFYRSLSLYLFVLLTSADFLYLSVLLQTITAMSLHFMPRHLFVGKYSLRSLCIFHKLITQAWCQTAAFANSGCSQSVFLCTFLNNFLPDWSVFKNKK